MIYTFEKVEILGEMIARKQCASPKYIEIRSICLVWRWNLQNHRGKSCLGRNYVFQLQPNHGESALGIGFGLPNLFQNTCRN